MHDDVNRFAAEDKIISEARAELQAPGKSAEQSRDQFRTMLNDYQRLLLRCQESERELERLTSRENNLLAQEQAKFHQLIEMGIALSAERNHSKLLEKILLAAKSFTNSDGGSIYLMNEEKRCLEFAIVRNDSLNIAMGGTSGQDINFPSLDLSDQTRAQHNVATAAAINGEVINIADAYNTKDFDFSGTRAFDRQTGYLSVSFLTIPMRAHDGTVIGVLQLINAKDKNSGQIITFNEADVPLVEALASQAAVALDNQNLINDQKRLMDSFIELIAGAIDEKSPYTGGHCQRVPELAMMLADAACENEEGIFTDFQMSEAQRYEFHIGTWLHDCGKVTTPEYVVDKATKLETIYNRIHEIRMRFEVLRRDAEIEALKQQLAGREDTDSIKSSLEARFAQLDDDFRFLADCNIGSEFMDPERQKRVKEISEQTWRRHYDDRLGLAHDELARKEREPAGPLPVMEKLLSDRVEHIIYRDAESVDRPFGDNPHGFNMSVPEYLYNNGEVYNLCIARGTLNDEERFKINDHIIQTISMLKALPFPREMRRVPEFAGGHHEKMDGTGYPCGLKREEMSIPARIVGVADIFEALTASDRPYKKAKTLSEALTIMTFMRKDQHIDEDIFELFLTSGIYRTYADRYLSPEQIDEVVIEDYL